MMDQRKHYKCTVTNRYRELHHEVSSRSLKLEIRQRWDSDANELQNSASHHEYRTVYLNRMLIAQNARKEENMLKEGYSKIKLRCETRG